MDRREFEATKDRFLELVDNLDQYKDSEYLTDKQQKKIESKVSELRRTANRMQGTGEDIDLLRSQSFRELPSIIREYDKEISKTKDAAQKSYKKELDSLKKEFKKANDLNLSLDERIDLQVSLRGIKDQIDVFDENDQPRPQDLALIKAAIAQLNVATSPYKRVSRRREDDDRESPPTEYQMSRSGSDRLPRFSERGFKEKDPEGVRRLNINTTPGGKLSRKVDTGKLVGPDDRDRLSRTLVKPTDQNVKLRGPKTRPIEREFQFNDPEIETLDPVTEPRGRQNEPTQTRVRSQEPKEEPKVPKTDRRVRTTARTPIASDKPAEDSFTSDKPTEDSFLDIVRRIRSKDLDIDDIGSTDSSKGGSKSSRRERTKELIRRTKRDLYFIRKEIARLKNQLNGLYKFKRTAKDKDVIRLANQQIDMIRKEIDRLIEERDAIQDLRFNFNRNV